MACKQERYSVYTLDSLRINYCHLYLLINTHDKSIFLSNVHGYVQVMPNPKGLPTHLPGFANIFKHLTLLAEET